ncbi:MAG: hypothetical protein WC729_19995 [Sphingomonas sp.]|uniref:hypothetical protein n=1 Tax=Sphingomonas sp. TaxID=28214 RepID=UPI003562A081
MKGFWLAALALLAGAPATAQPIDRLALVKRHDVTLTKVDPHAPLMLGNGSIGFTADITGLQTFPDQYAKTAPLLTMAQWAWHSFPNPHGYTEANGLVQVPVPGGGTQPYSYMRDFDLLKTNPSLVWLRENPHRFSLGRIALALKGRDGKPARFEALSATRQHLDLWTGALSSSFRFEGQPVAVTTRVHPDRDMVVVEIRSPLVASGRIGVDVRYPGVSRNLNPDPSDYGDAADRKTLVLARGPGSLMLSNRIDDTVYYSTIAATGATVSQAGQQEVHVAARRGDRLVVFVSFDRTRKPAPRTDYAAATAAVSKHWRDYWSTGGMIDFSGSTDPRAPELERRILLSQYLAAINQAGDVPPQEEGLFSNSWNGKFHLEVHPWHAGHFALWGRPALLERSMAWYLDRLPQAKAEAARHGVLGAWWTKMSGPEGRNSPSPINPFIMWQQPHPIYMAELLYRAHPDATTLARYGELVDQTARLLATWPRWDAAGKRFVLGPPIIPVQENHDPMTTMNPAYEVEYFRWGLKTAQAWRERRGLKRVADWDKVIDLLGPVPQRDGLYLPVESEPDFWKKVSSPECRRNAIGHDCLNRDHPSFLMAYGAIGGDHVDPETMRRTLRAVESDWDLRQTWGWDFPMIAMTAARLGEPEKAIDWLFRDTANNQWGVSGMTPRAGFDPAVKSGPDGPGYARVADTYFPSNGGLLLVTGMMAAGWDGSTGPAPGFPKQGWRVRVEGIRPLP